MGLVDERTSGNTLNKESKKSEIGLLVPFDGGLIVAFWVVITYLYTSRRSRGFLL